MKIALYSRPSASPGGEELSALFAALDDHAFSVQLNGDFARQVTEKTGRRFTPEQLYSTQKEISADTQIMISYGGDGTFLEAVRLLDLRPVPVIGINSGRLGFLANITKAELAPALSDLCRGNYTVEERTLLAAEGDLFGSESYPYAFNELTVQRRGTSMLAAEVFVDGEMIATCHGDGVLVSTPSGSTAYSLSVGGPVVAPACRCFVISPIAPHNLTMRPVVVPDTSEISFRVHTRDEQFFVSLDNRNFLAEDGACFKVRKAEKSIFLVHLQNISFYDTLRNKMMWGIDTRDPLNKNER